MFVHFFLSTGMLQATGHSEHLYNKHVRISKGEVGEIQACHTNFSF